MGRIENVLGSGVIVISLHGSPDPRPLSFGPGMRRPSGRGYDDLWLSPPVKLVLRIEGGPGAGLTSGEVDRSGGAAR